MVHHQEGLVESGGRKGSGPARRGAVGGRKELPGACRSQQQQEQWYSSKCPLLLLEKSSSSNSGRVSVGRFLDKGSRDGMALQ